MQAETNTSETIAVGAGRIMQTTIGNRGGAADDMPTTSAISPQNSSVWAAAHLVEKVCFRLDEPHGSAESPCMNVDPMLVTDAVLDAALASDAELVRIEPAAAGQYALAVSRQGEVLAKLALAAPIAALVIARLSYLCGLDPSDRRVKSGRTRVRSVHEQRDAIVTIQSNPPRAELMLVPCERKQVEPAIGERIGHYRVIAPLGNGGVGNVYEVVHERLGRRHALKVLQSWVLEQDDGGVERFLREAQAAARIRSSHIVEVFDFGYLDDGRPYIVMELLAGQSLADLVAAGPVQPARAVSLALQLARALTAAHDRGVIHADITPANVIVTGDHVTLIDFGLAHLGKECSDAPADHVSGTPSYLAPERVRGFAADEAADQYAFGIVLYELLQGHPPFAGTPHDIGMAHLYAVPPAITGSQLPAGLDALIARCLAKAAADRFPSMHAVLVDLLAIEEVLS